MVAHRLLRVLNLPLDTMEGLEGLWTAASFPLPNCDDDTIPELRAICFSARSVKALYL
jgi:hypothetical protein